MTLREMRAAYPHLFYKQDWFDGEAFMETEPSSTLPDDEFFSFTVAPRWWCPRWLSKYTAADIAHLWVHTYGTRPMFDKYVWTCDKDSHGQRVYLGQNGKGLEIHRHLHLTDRWGIPV
jgi:hypothetical protein